MSFEKPRYVVATIYLSFVFFNLICPTFILSVDADVEQKMKTKRGKNNILDNADSSQVLIEKPRYQLPYPSNWQILNSGFPQGQTFFRYSNIQLYPRTGNFILIPQFVQTLSQGTDRHPRDVLSDVTIHSIHDEPSKVTNNTDEAIDQHRDITGRNNDVIGMLGRGNKDGFEITDETIEGRSRKVQGCCWKIKVAFTTGNINGSYKLHQYIFGYYTMEPGLINGRNHYRSVHNDGAFAISFCGDSWWIQAKENVGECKGWAHSGWTSDDCVHEIEYSWRYYIPVIDEFVAANKGLSSWCKS